MTALDEIPMPHLEVPPATAEQEPVLANLLELYAHDFSEFHDVELGLDGRFGYPGLSLYWSEPGRHPFLIKIDHKLAGFVLVHLEHGGEGHEAVWDMAEFFVVRKYRRRNVGTQVAHQVWRHFPGRWQVRVMESNVTALRFWQKAISWFKGEAVGFDLVEKNGKFWRVFSFESKS